MPPSDPHPPGHLIGADLRPSVGSLGLDGPRPTPGAGSEALRATAAERLGGGARGRRASIDDSARVSANPEVLEAPLDGELVLLDPVVGAYFGLNQTGAAIWSLLREGRSVVAAALSERFGVELERARADVDRLMGRLEDAGLVLRSGPCMADADARC